MAETKVIPEGYKRSPLGVIPEEWEVKRLGEICIEARLGGNYENAESNSGIPVVKMGNIGRGKVVLDKVQYLPLDEQYNHADVLKYDDLLFNTRNTLELVGKVAIWRDELPYAIYNSNLLRIYFDKQSVYSNEYMNTAFNSYLSIKQLRGYATGTTSVAAIYSRDLFKMKFTLPPLAEQERITEILGCLDKGIELQGQLVEKFELRKRALMQQLLTGRTRLKGFSGAWKDYHLGDMFKERNESKFDNLPLLSVGQDGIYPQSESDKKDTSNLDKSKYKRICVGDIGYNTMRMWQGRSALSSLEGIVSPAYTVVSPKSGCNALFFSYLFKMPKTTNLFWRNSQGLVDDTLNCKFKDFSIVKMALPLLAEQTAIAKILTSADKEIDLARAKLAILRKQKKGLMQQLLTGKTRVKN